SPRRSGGEGVRRSARSCRARSACCGRAGAKRHPGAEPRAGAGALATGERRRAPLGGGGVGTAPLAIWRGGLLARGEPAPALLGFRDAEHAPGAELLQNPRLATDDGSHGHPGLVTDLLAAELDQDDHVVVYACGPPPMLEAVRAICEQRGVPNRLALESGMACGFGACFGCVVPLRAGGYLRLCVDGPVLHGALPAEVPAPW